MKLPLYGLIAVSLLLTGLSCERQPQTAQPLTLPTELQEEANSDTAGSTTTTTTNEEPALPMPNDQDGAVSSPAEGQEPMPVDTPSESGFTGTVLAGSPLDSPLLDFNPVDYNRALETNRLIVLYFYANWCPICREEIPHLYGAFESLTDDDVVGFRVNFNDNETDDFERELARQFGVSYQHTKVFIKDKQRVLKAPDSWQESRYIQEINTYR